MTHNFPRHSKITPPIAIAGAGCHITDATGKQYFDGSGGAAVSCLGHGDADIATAMKDQIDKLSFAHTSFFTSMPAEALADLLIANAPSGIDRVYFVSGGSEAIEASLKLARQYFVETGSPQRSHIIARKQSYHGNTLGALAAGGNAWRREQFAPLLFTASHIEPCYRYRGKADGESDHAYGQRMANALETEILRLGADKVMAFLAEPVVGATLGAVAAEWGYFTRIREICDRYGVLLILDEVMCGMGRTGSLFACDHDQVRPDIIAIAKGLGAGYQPVGAMLCSKEIYAAIAEGSGFFQHGHTYLAHPVACAAAHAVLSKIIDSDLPSRATMMGDKLMQALQSAFGQHPFIGDIRGRGLFIGMEFVADRAQKTPFDPALGLHRKIKAAAFEAGLLCYPMGGTIDGKNGDHLLLAPPFILEDSHIGEIIDKLTIAFDAAMPPA
ncbi:aspartate aminotransferase family protein [Alphaproteobacteria bacterium]|nr:aspartate aminotransferase family protein [Alphaproteobacteria bacterium]MDA9824232.1 aspartate aminotransferase family protein [Alphaproteobacteria bacterium]MDC1191477.1 aspartate aminotransferase family protein [Candidatus Puniceispirillum sp.]